MPPRALRLFVAVYPPIEIAEALLGALSALELPAHRLTPVAQVHLTLQFIGRVSVGEIEGVGESVERAIAGVGARTFGLRVSRLRALPQRGPARLVAAETDAPATLSELQKRLAQRLARSPRARAGERFVPHLTLCRFRSPQRLVRRDWDAPACTFEADSIRLMRSVLLPEGAEHREVARFALEG